MFRTVLAFALVLAPLAAVPAAADPQCRMVHAHLVIQADPVPTCGSPIGLCATATLQGSLNATTTFVGTSFQETDDTMDTGVVILTGDNTFHLDGGTVTTKDAIVLATTGAGEFAEVDTVFEGSGDWEDATGVLIASGTFVNGQGVGIIDGEICRP